jgi:hypothetical protein
MGGFTIGDAEVAEVLHDTEKFLVSRVEPRKVFRVAANGSGANAADRRDLEL